MHHFPNRLFLFILKSSLSVFSLLIHNSYAHAQGWDWETQDSLLRLYGHQGDSVAQLENVTILKFQTNHTHHNDSTITSTREFECRIHDSILVTVKYNYTSYSDKFADKSFYSSEHIMDLRIVNNELREFNESKSDYQNKSVKNGARDSIQSTNIENSSVHLIFYKNQLIFQMSDGHDLGAEETFDGTGYAFGNLEYVLGEIRKKYPWIK